MLVLLDIDGTLCDTFQIDGDCYIEALRQCFGFTDISTDWGSYPHTTDSGILQQVFDSKLGREPTADETKLMVECFHDLLQAEFQSIPGSCQPIKGGPEFVAGLRSHDVPFAIATGGWHRTAMLKLRAAGYGDLEVPIATADIALSRLDICRWAVDSANELYQQALEPIVYVGDGAWDQQASLKLGYNFIGRSANPAKFPDASFVIPDFRGADLMEKLLALQSGA